MFDANWEQTLDTFRQEMASVKGQAGTLSNKFAEVCRETESFKVAFLNHCLERQRRHLSRSRGLTSVIRSRKGLGKSLAMGAAGLVLGAIISRDKFFAVREGLTGFNAGLRELGETSWVVCLGKDLKILPRGDIAKAYGKTLVTWESFKSGLAQLEKEALRGGELGGLDSILSRLKECKELVYVGAVQFKMIRKGTIDPKV